ncbi:MAG: YraN family protein [Candidatus Taylorbacteria bacterium]
MHTRSKGNIGENVACHFLTARGFSIIARNYMKKWGELDIVAIKDRVVHFFEVKSVTFDIEDSGYSHTAEENVHGFKRRQIRRMVETFLSETNRGIEAEFCFHVLCVYLNMSTRMAKVKMIRDVIL